MDRSTVKQFTHNAKSFLSLENNLYKQWVFRYTFLELEKDLGTKGDVTTNYIFDKNEKKPIKAKVIAKEDGIIAGIEEVKYFLVDADPNFRPHIRGNFGIMFKVEDGQKIQKGDTIMEISADIHDLLAAERVLLNLLMRMSGIATFTRDIVNKVKEYGTLITPTRKTLWGLLDKKAVSVGGGGTHRLNLADSVLIKDTHLDAENRNFDGILSKVIENKPDCRFIEVEVLDKKETLIAAEKLYKLLKESGLMDIGVIMFDNMSPQDVKGALDEMKNKKLYDNLLFEASGGINEKNVEEYAKTGVDIISMGCLTNGVRSLDMSMKVTK